MKVRFVREHLAGGRVEWSLEFDRGLSTADRARMGEAAEERYRMALQAIGSASAAEAKDIADRALDSE